MPENSEHDLADDILKGAAKIAAFTGELTRRTYYLADRKLIPVFWVGKILHARKSELRDHYRAKPEAV